MANYSKSEKTLHKLYLSNYFISRSSLEVEQILFGSKASHVEVEQYVFVSGLARSGTTALMRGLFGTGEFASLQYSNMPILLSPNLWNKKLNLESHERAHGDGIIIDGNSPEEFDEYFWKAFLRDSYIGNGLSVHQIEDSLLEKYRTYVKLICLSKGKTKYISKNNNNILRLESLKKLENSRIIILFREPLAHAASLRKLHLSFTQTQQKDPFALDYFNYLGHHEFGLGHKPFLLQKDFIEKQDSYSKEELDYWIYSWINYYEYLLEHLDDSIQLIAFEDLISDPESVYARLKDWLGYSAEVDVPKKHTPSKYTELKCDPDLAARAEEVYNKLYKRS